MKIIRKGHPDDEREGAFECKVCRSLVQAMVKEASGTHGSYRGKYLDFQHCDRTTTIEDTDFFRNLENFKNART